MEMCTCGSFPDAGLRTPIDTYRWEADGPPQPCCGHCAQHGDWLEDWEGVSSPF